MSGETIWVFGEAGKDEKSWEPVLGEADAPREVLLRRKFILTKNNNYSREGFIPVGTHINLALIYKWKPQVVEWRMEGHETLEHNARFVRYEGGDTILCDHEMDHVEHYYEASARQRYIVGVIKSVGRVLAGAAICGLVGIVVAVFGLPFIGNKTVFNDGQTVQVAFWCLVGGLAAFIPSAIYFSRRDIFFLADARQLGDLENVPGKTWLMFWLYIAGFWGITMFVGLIWWVFAAVAMLVMFGILAHRYSQRPEPVVVAEVPAAPPPPEPPKTTGEQVIEELFKKK